MDLIQEDIHYEWRRMTYWVRIHIKYENAQSVVLVCASQNYISDYFKLTAPVKETDTKAWLEDVLRDLKEEGDSLLQQKVNYKVYAYSPEGKKNGLEFLQNEVTP